MKNLLKNKYIIFIICLCILGIGVFIFNKNQDTQKNNNNTVFIYNGYEYIVTNEKINKNNVEDEVAEISKRTNKYPENNFESNKLDEGTKIFNFKKEVEDNDTSGATYCVNINDEYFVAREIKNFK